MEKGLNDRSSPTCRHVNLHVGVANRFIPNNVQTMYKQILFKTECSKSDAHVT